MSKRLREFYSEVINSPKSEHRDSRVLIIDGLNTFIRIFAAVPSINDNGEHVGGIAGFMKSIAANIRQFSPTRCVIVFDGKGGSGRRRKLYPEYKANRKNKTKLNRHEEFDNPEDAVESMKQQLSRIIKYLDNLPITYFAIDNIEADDSIAYLVTEYFQKRDSHVTIVSTDRDFLQLVNSQVNVFNPIKKKLYTEEEIIAEFGIHPNNYLLYRIIDGDASDNIKGISGVGLKTLIKEIPEITSVDLEVDDLIGICEELAKQKKPKKFVSNILENINVLQLNYKLMQLNTSDIPTNSKFRIIDCVSSDSVSINHFQIRKLFAEDGLNTIVKDFDSWLSNSFGKLNSYGKSE